MKKGFKQLSIGLVCFVLCFFVTILARGVASNALGSLGNSTELKDEMAKTELLQYELSKLQTNLNQLETLQSQDKETIEILNKQLTASKTLAGLTNVEGPGVILTITDGSLIGSFGQPVEQPVHDSDLLRIVNELKSAGAEAVSLNDQRIVSISEIRCVGPVVNVNGVKSATPFIIKAIGAPQTLKEALLFKGGIVETLSHFNITVDIVESENVTIEKYTGDFSPQFIKEQGEDMP